MTAPVSAPMGGPMGGMPGMGQMSSPAVQGVMKALQGGDMKAAMNALKQAGQEGMQQLGQQAQKLSQSHNPAEQKMGQKLTKMLQLASRMLGGGQQTG